MAKLNADALLQKFLEIRSKNGSTSTIGSLLKDAAVSDDNTIVDGKIDIAEADLIVTKIEELIEKFKQQTEFNWRIHVLDPVHVIVEIASMIGDYGDRQYMEDLVVVILKDLYSQYTPKIPYVPNFLAKWILGIVADKLIPWLVDWILDVIYGEDESKETE